MSQPEKRLTAIHGRLHKHLGATSPRLADALWQRLQATLLQRYARLEDQITKFYPTVALQTSYKDFSRIVGSIGAPSGHR